MEQRRKIGEKRRADESIDVTSVTSSGSTTSSDSFSVTSSSPQQITIHVTSNVSSSVSPSSRTSVVTVQKYGGTSPLASSFIAQRVERLYGRDALAQGFHTRRSLPASTTASHTITKEQSEEMERDDGGDSESALPVLKLLRPEFRAQLPVAKKKSSSTVCSARPADMTDGAAARVSPFDALMETMMRPIDETNNSKENEKTETDIKPVKKDGDFYLKLVLYERDMVLELAAQLESFVESGGPPEYMEGRMRAAVGKAKLLASQKLAQFIGLCHSNINQDLCDGFPTTDEDLAGFWDMVLIQIKQVKEEYKKILDLKNAGWPEQECLEEGVQHVKISNGSSTSASRRAKSLPLPTKAAVTKTSAASKARDEARKKMLAERRKEMKKGTNPDDDFVL